MANFPTFQQVATYFEQFQDKICTAIIKAIDQKYKQENWDYKNGTGGGKTRVFEGIIIEKGGVNFSNIEGVLSLAAAKKLNLDFDQKGNFQACGVSVILHPYNPFVPAVHLNVRHFQSGQNCWFGGGVDLNPYYPLLEDIIFFHTNLKKLCDQFDKNYYSQFKKNCDQYFYNKHRNQMRGVGGIFFDRLKKKDFDFVLALADFFSNVYLAIIKKRMHSPFRHYQKEYQDYRRACYAEFNLLYDKGTAFGLETGGRVESIFLSLPPTAKWSYQFNLVENSEEQKHQKFFQPTDWIVTD